MMRSFVVDGRIIAVRASGLYAATVRELDRRSREDARETMPPPPESLRDWAPPGRGRKGEGR